MRHIQSAGIITYHTNNNVITYLLLHYAHGHWDFVKGKIESNENKHEAALRELREETGITAITIDPNFSESFSYVYTEVDGIVTKKTVYFFVGCTPETDVTLSDEHQDYAWLPFEEAMERLTFENAREVLRATHRYITSRSSLRPSLR